MKVCPGLILKDFFLRREISVQISMIAREDRADKKPSLQAENLMDYQRQELIAFYEEEIMSAMRISDTHMSDFESHSVSTCLYML